MNSPQCCVRLYPNCIDPDRRLRRRTDDRQTKKCFATDKNAADTRAADEEAIRAAGKAFVEAYNARDAKKLASLYTPEAVYLDP